MPTYLVQPKTAIFGIRKDPCIKREKIITLEHPNEVYRCLLCGRVYLIEGDKKTLVDRNNYKIPFSNNYNHENIVSKTIDKQKNMQTDDVKSLGSNHIIDLEIPTEQIEVPDLDNEKNNIIEEKKEEKLCNASTTPIIIKPNNTKPHNNKMSQKRH